MTQKNGTIEFIKAEDQSPSVYVKEYKRLIRFDKHSKKYFTHDPIEIKLLDSLGYSRGKVKIDGVAVLASDMTEDEKIRVEKNLNRQAKKIGVDEAPELVVEDEDKKEKTTNDVIVKIGDKELAKVTIKENFEKEVESIVSEDIKLDVDKSSDKKEEVKKDKKETKKDKPKKKKASSKLKKEIG